MPPYKINFSLEEYQERIAKTRGAMSVRGVDVLIVSDPSNMHWLTGYDGWSFYVHQAVILGMEGEPVWWGRAMDGVGARLTAFLSHENIIGYEDSYVQNPEKHPMETLAVLLNERNYGELRIGVELDNYYYSAAAHGSLVENLAKAAFLDTTGLVNWQRGVKSATEIKYMRRAAKIVEAMHNQIVEIAEPGMRKNDLIAEICRTAIKGAHGHWGDYPAIVPMAPSGMDATAPHLTWDDRPLIAGESTFFELAGVHHHYHATQSRTLFIGKPPQKYLDAEKAVLEAVEVGLEQAKPGNLAEDIAIAFNSALNRLGFEKEGRCGYAIGLSYPPDWGERTISFRPGDRTILKEGMSFHFMPALWLDDGGLEITEPILIGKNRAECLCSTPRKLIIKN